LAGGNGGGFERGGTIKGRSRSNTAHSYTARLAQTVEDPADESHSRRPSIRSRAPSNLLTPTISNTSASYYEAQQTSPPRLGAGSRSHSFQSAQGTSPQRRDLTPTQHPVMSRMNSFASEAGSVRGGLRPVNTRVNTWSSAREEHNGSGSGSGSGGGNGANVFGDPSDDSNYANSTSSRSPGARSISPATSHDSTNLSRKASWNDVSAGVGGLTIGGGIGKKAPPPPPPSRSKKPPPPPPVKREGGVRG
jgi:hypothetical protein